MMQARAAAAGPATEPGTARDWLLALLLATFAFFSAVPYIDLIPAGEPPDEWAHLSYVHDIASGNHGLPDFEDSRILNSGRPNYLKHPALYYAALGWVGRIADLDARTDYRAYRAISAFLAALGVLFWALACRRFNLSPALTAATIGACVAVPMFPYMSAAVNNDALILASVGAFFYGLGEFNHRARAGAWIVATALLVTFLTKATASLFLVSFLAALAMFHRRDLLRMATPQLLVPFAVVAIVCGAYYASMLGVHGRLFPRPADLYAAQPPADPLSLAAYARTFVETMLLKLPAVTSHNSFRPVRGFLLPVFYAMLALPVVFALVTRPRASPGAGRSPSVTAGDAFAVALLATIGVHVVFRYYGHYLNTGVLSGMQPRYYAYALPGIFLFSLAGRSRWPVGRAVQFLFAFAVVVLLATVPARVPVAHVERGSAVSVERISLKSGALRDLELGAALQSGTVGRVDEFRIDKGRLRVRGWATDRSGRRAARRIWILHEEHLLGPASVDHPRRDVVEAMRNQRLLRSGFRFDVVDLPAGLSACAVSVVAEEPGGGMVPVTNRFCTGAAGGADQAASSASPNGSPESVRLGL